MDRPGAALTAAGRRLRIPAELAGYAIVAVGLFALLWSHARRVDAFYLDEWFYTHGADYMWENFPGAVLGTIPEWNRGPQRAYSALLAAPWGALGTSAAFTVSHLMNVALLVSAMVPAALFARRVIESAGLRVLAVALAVGVPWLTISAHLLTENLAFPVFLWAVYLIVRAAESPSWVNQALALGAIAALGLVRLNLAPLFAVLVLAVLLAEIRRRRDEREQRAGAWMLQALRRQAPMISATVLGVVAALALLLRGSSGLGAYGGFTLDSIADNLWGERAELMRRTFLTYARGLVVGSLVMPMALGLGVALAGAFGRLGRRFTVPSLVALGGLVVVLGGVSMWTAGAALEERYVFYAYAPLAVLAVAGLEVLERLRRWVGAGSALVLWALITGIAAPAGDAGHFFAAPAGAFWTRVLDHRLRAYEQDLLGWAFLGPTGWLLLAVAAAVLVAVVAHASARPRVVRWLLTCGLAVCAAGQLAILDYSYGQELDGTVDAGGGIALSPGRDEDRETWLDRAVPGDPVVGILPGVIGLDTPYGGHERMSFWNRDADVTVATTWNGAPGTAPPGYQVIETYVGADKIARWNGSLPPWLTVHADDPRIQIPGRLMARSPTSRFVLYRTEGAERAVWTGDGLDADGAVQSGRPVVFTLDRAAMAGVREVRLELKSPDGAAAPVRWQITQAGRTVAAGRVEPTEKGTARLAVPPCDGSPCSPVSWRLSTVGPEVSLPLPAYGAQGPGRPVELFVHAAALG